MKKTIYIAILLLLTSCKAKEVIKYVPVEKIHTEQVIVHDTLVDIRLIPYRDSVIVADTISRLENKYACSTALFTNNKLHHSLAVKEINIPVEIQYIEKIITDSIQVPIEVKGDTIIQYRHGVIWWIGIGAIIIFLLFVLLKLRKLLNRQS